MASCPHCHDFGYVQMYCTRVIRVYCDCPAGDRRVEEIKKDLTDPESPDYKWTRRSDILKLKYPTSS